MAMHNPTGPTSNSVLQPTLKPEGCESGRRSKSLQRWTQPLCFCVPPLEPTNPCTAAFAMVSCVVKVLLTTTSMVVNGFNVERTVIQVPSTLLMK